MACRPPFVCRFRSAILATCTLWAIESACAATLHVAPAGADANPGTADAPLATVAAALARSGGGDTILLQRGGVFREGGLTVTRRTLGAYGDSAAPLPVLAGSRVVGGWTPVSGRPGVLQAPLSGATPAQVRVNGRLMTLARFPNEGWLFQDSDTGDDTIVDAALREHPRNAAGLWVGAQVRWRKWSWWYETRPVTGYDGNGRLSLGGRTSLSVNGDQTGCGYFIDNVFAELDHPGEWWWDAATQVLYLMPPAGVAWEGAIVEAASLANGVTLGTGASMQDIHLRDYTQTGVMVTAPATLERCVISNVGNIGLNLSWDSSPSLVRDCAIRDVLNKGIQLNQNPARVGGTVIERNRLDRIGMVPGLAGNSTQQAIGIDISNGNAPLIQLNRLTEIGYSGINTHSSAAPATPSSGYVIRRNVVRRAMATLNDGAGIRLVCDYNQAVENIVLDTIGDLESSQPWTPLGHALWAEFVGHPQPDGSIVPFKGNVMDRNTLFGSGGHGIFLTMQEQCSVRDNVIVSNWLSALNLSARVAWSPRTEHEIHGNLFAIGARRWRPFPEETPQRLATWSRPNDFALTYNVYDNVDVDYGRMSGNTFLTPAGGEHIGRGGTALLTLAQWQSAEADWADPSPGVQQGRAYSFINDTEASRALPLPGAVTWTHLDGAPAAGRVTVAPFRSVLLLAAGGSELNLQPYYLASELDEATPPPVTTSALTNLSVRSPLGGNETLIVGAVSAGEKAVLVRAAGPALLPFGVQGLRDPELELYLGSRLAARNDDWPNSLAFVADAVGAFPFANGSADAALYRTVDGAFSAQARGPAAGTVLVEVYDVSGGLEARLLNLSARRRVGTGDDILIAGFALAGTGSKRLLIRAAGPALAGFGITGTLAAPRLVVRDARGASLADSAAWDAALAPVFARVGAFPFPPGSRDAALMTSFAAGATYTVEVSGADGGTGEALVEIYEVL